MRKIHELSQSDIIDAIKDKYGIRFAASIEFLIDMHGKPSKMSGMPISGTISAIAKDIE